MKKSTQEFLRKQNKLRTKPGKPIARKENPATTKAAKAKANKAPAAEAAPAGQEKERKQ